MFLFTLGQHIGEDAILRRNKQTTKVKRLWAQHASTAPVTKNSVAIRQEEIELKVFTVVIKLQESKDERKRFDVD